MFWICINRREVARVIIYIRLVVVWSLSCVWLFCNPMDYTRQVLLSMEFSRQEYWSGLPFPSPGDLPDLGIEPVSPELAGRFFTAEPPGKSVIGKRMHVISPGLSPQKSRKVYNQEVNRGGRDEIKHTWIIQRKAEKEGKRHYMDGWVKQKIKLRWYIRHNFNQKFHQM